MFIKQLDIYIYIYYLINVVLVINIITILYSMKLSYILHLFLHINFKCVFYKCNSTNVIDLQMCAICKCKTIHIYL